MVVKWASRRMDRPNPRPLAQGRDGGISSAILPAHPASLKFDATAASGVILEKWLNFRIATRALSENLRFYGQGLSERVSGRRTGSMFAPRALRCLGWTESCGSRVAEA